MPQRFTNPVIKYTTDTLKALPGALLYFYENGTTTPKVTYQDVALVTPHANPVVADSAGNFPPIFLDGTYTVVLRSAAGVTQSGWPVDNVGGEEIEGQFDRWSSITNYAVGDLVTADNGLRYESLQTPNLNQEPSISPLYWEWLPLTDSYEPLGPYKTGDWVVYQGEWYRAKADSTGQEPSSSSAYWDAEKIVFQWNQTTTYPIGTHVFVGEDEYISRQSANLNHNPVGDSGAWWNPISVQLGVTLSGGGALNRSLPNFLIDSLTYTLPAASSLAANSVVFVIKQDRYRTAQPIIQGAGSDTITNATGATDTSIQMDYGYKTTLEFKTNGVSNWSV